jgi:hypothetical protein
MLHRLRHPQARERGEEKMAGMGLAYEALSRQRPQQDLVEICSFPRQARTAAFPQQETNLPPSAVGIAPSSL